MSALKNSKVQEAVVDKGLEVMNKLVDKQLRIIDEAQEKASKFLAKEVSGKNSGSFIVFIFIVVQVAKAFMARIKGIKTLKSQLHNDNTVIMEF